MLGLLRAEQFEVSTDVPSARQFGPSSRRTGLMVSEIMYHPPDPFGDEMEYVELFNTEPVDHDISGFRICSEIDYRFPEGTTVPTLGYLVVGRNPAFLEASYMTNGTPYLTGVLGPYTNRLSNASGRLRLRNRWDALLLEIEYSDSASWLAAADGAGSSLVLSSPDFGENNAHAWSASATSYCNPGLADSSVTNALRHIVINEFLAHTDLPQVDFIEMVIEQLTARGLMEASANSSFTSDPVFTVHFCGMVRM